jgi:hypothetical protein
MKITIILLLSILLIVTTPLSLFPAPPLSGVRSINSSDLESIVSFLASPLLKGRMNGEEGLEIASSFIATQAKLTGLKPAAGDSFFQPFAVIRKSIDKTKSSFLVTEDGKQKSINKPFLQIFPEGASDFVTEGEIVFAGYGITSELNNYNDLDSVTIEDRIILIMDRAPTTDDGKKSKFGGSDWLTFKNIQMKLPRLMIKKPAAILIVADPKSGSLTMDEQYPGFSGYFEAAMSLRGKNEREFFLPEMPKVISIHREVADELLEGTGFNLEKLQKEIDLNLKPHSFSIKNKKLKITEASLTEEITLKNVAGYIEGRDPVLKNEFVIFSGHMDHIGAGAGGINCGADDNASGCAALLSIAKAFKTMKTKPLRSVLFLWVSGEEIGMFGSEYYVDNPLIPLSNTVADLNIDMIGRVEGIADTSAENPMTGKRTVFVITGKQSKDLSAIAERIDKRSVLDFDYSLSDRNHPLEFFERSDQYNFVRKDIPAIFFTSGTHTDYHTPGDTADKIDYEKMELVTRVIFELGHTLADRRKNIKVDNPFNSWSSSGNMTIE